MLRFLYISHEFFPHFSLVFWGSGNLDTYSCCIAAFIKAFVWDACKDLTLIILMVAAAVSLALGITTEVRVSFVFAP
jgi:hypothetical protein